MNLIGMNDKIFRSSLPAFILLFLAGCSGCSTIGYYAQAVNGHFDLMSKRQPIEKLLKSPDTDPELKRKLVLLRDARQYAVKDLLLPDNESYSTYAESGREAITWNVVATPEFSMAPKKWCFPVAGCVSYRGYFDRKDADAYEATLKEEGFDTQIGGASAYSTLGWFDDPLLDTMLRGGDIRLASVLFHELAHQLIYIKDDSSFNEAFASFVEQEGARRWLKSIGKSSSIAGYDDYLARQLDFNQLLQSTRQELVDLYRQELDAKVMRENKQAVFDSMRDKYSQLKNEKWNGFTGYDNWFARDLNNARLIAVSTYRKWIPAYAAIFKEQGEDFDKFYVRIRELADMDFEPRQKLLREYLEASS